jgi:hypothetical protein
MTSCRQQGSRPNTCQRKGRRSGAEAVATRVGHASVSFTLDRYGHLYPDADVLLRDQLDQLIRRSADGPETAPAG